MKQALFLLLYLLLVSGSAAGELLKLPLTLPGKSPTEAADALRTYDFAADALGLRLALRAEEPYQSGGDPMVEVLPLTMSTCEILWEDSKRAVIVVKAKPPTTTSRTESALLLSVRMSHGECRVVDYKRFSAYGLYARISMEATSSGNNGSQEVMPVVITVSADQGGRGYSHRQSQSYSISSDDGRIETMQMPE